MYFHDLSTYLCNNGNVYAGYGKNNLLPKKNSVNIFKEWKNE